MSRRSTVPARIPGAPLDYQCVKAGEVWHAVQEQASPPPVHQGGAWTICAIWGPFTRGYERRRPDCGHCLRACQRDEGVYVEPRMPNTPPAVTAKYVEAITAPEPAVVAKLAATRTAVAAEESDFDARLRALVDTTRRRK